MSRRSVWAWMLKLPSWDFGCWAGAEGLSWSLSEGKGWGEGDLLFMFGGFFSCVRSMEEMAWVLG